MAFDLTVNGSVHRVDADPQTPLLWIIRDHVGLTGAKFSCGIGQCGACTVHVDGRAIRSCSVPASTAIGKPIRCGSSEIQRRSIRARPRRSARSFPSLVQAPWSERPEQAGGTCARRATRWRSEPGVVPADLWKYHTPPESSVIPDPARRPAAAASRRVIGPVRTPGSTSKAKH